MEVASAIAITDKGVTTTIARAGIPVSYTHLLPHKLLEKVGIESLRLYASGENIYYWSPLKKVTQYIDPEAAFNRSSAVNNNAYYPWPKTYMFGIDIKF